ncbi:hypothetical protein [Methanosarcina sp. UBA411]|uniref:hypothetical protein n=1 Tax=Methanosarcina sp. UBA411 TaxID=1915589 RepID=UPI0025EF254C|nr:hypothetical protein [Methanosarcina sp. UBA411]
MDSGSPGSPDKIVRVPSPEFRFGSTEPFSLRSRGLNKAQVSSPKSLLHDSRLGGTDPFRSLRSLKRYNSR